MERKSRDVDTFPLYFFSRIQYSGININNNTNNRFSLLNRALYFVLIQVFGLLLQNKSMNKTPSFGLNCA